MRIQLMFLEINTSTSIVAKYGNIDNNCEAIGTPSACI